MNKFDKYLSDHINLIQALKDNTSLYAKIEDAVREIVNRLNLGGKLIVCGNGGSAADAQHIVAELVGKFNIYRAPIAALSLTTNTSILTAWSNDHDFQDVFARQVHALGRHNDVLIGISTSGKSENIINAFKAAKELDIYCIGLTGEVRTSFESVTDITLNVPSAITPLIQEAHIVIYHYICSEIELQMCNKC